MIKRASKISNFTFEDFNTIYSKLCHKKVLNILKDKSHPLNTQIIFSERSGRPLSIRSNRERYTSSFLLYHLLSDFYNQLLKDEILIFNYISWNFYVLLEFISNVKEILYMHIFIYIYTCFMKILNNYMYCL